MADPTPPPSNPDDEAPASEDEGAPGASTSTPPKNQRKRIFKATGWLAVGHGLAQVLSLASSLVLTRLLAAEVYGLMELVYVFYTGIHMFSDLGLAQNIIQSHRGDDVRFLNTAWTVQVLRGSLLFVVTWGLGPLVAWADGESQLMLLIPAVGVTAVLDGLASTALHTESRKLNIDSVVKIEIASRVFTIIVQILVALVWPSAWALVFGAWVGTATKTWASHKYIPTHAHRFAWDREAIRELFSFGGWIFGSTALTFAYSQGDRLILNAFVTKAELGVYGIALRLKAVIQGVQGTLVRTILMPVLAEKNRELFGLDDDARIDELSRLYYRARLRIDAVFVTAAGGLMTFGKTLIISIYPPEYHLAGDIIQVLSVQIAMMAALGSTEAILTGLGHTKHYFLQSLGRVAVVLIGVPIGWYLAGFWGLVWAMALIELPTGFILLGQMRNLKLLRVHRELLALAFLALGALLGWLVSTAVLALQLT